MAEDSLFDIDIVRDFMVQQGGRVTNHELVTHFRTFLNDSKRKVANRQKFKTFVNTLASVKLDENGEKVLVLKKRYRDINVPVDFQPASSPRSQPKDGSGKKPCAERVVETPPEPAPPEEVTECSPPAIAVLDGAGTEEILAGASDVPTFNDSMSRFEQEAKAGFGDTPRKVEREERTSPIPVLQMSLQEDNVEPPKPPGSSGKDIVNSGDGAPSTEDVMTSSITSSHSMHSNHSIASSHHSITDSLSSTQEPERSLGGDAPVDQHSMSSQHSVDKSQVTADGQDGSVLSAEDTLSPPASATIPEDVFSTPAQPKPQLGPDGEPILQTPMSVKQQIQQLNRQHSEGALLNTTTAKIDKELADSVNDDDSHSSMTISLDAEEKEWMVTSSQADYHAMMKLLRDNPQLAKRKDFTSGFTALHWASKHGQAEVVKMLCGSHGVHVNTKSHGGYTPLHLAAIQGHEDIIELLVQVYNADANIRDYSGKKPKQYLRNSASTRAQQILQVRRLSQNVVNSGGQPFRRQGSYSSKIRTAGHFGINAGNVVRNSWMGDNVSRSASPSPSQSPRLSPRQPRKANASPSPQDGDLMPPPKGAPSTRRRRTTKNTPRDQPNSEDDISRSGSENDISAHRQSPCDPGMMQVQSTV